MAKTIVPAMLVLIGLAVAARAEPDSRTLYALHCMGCHQRHGEGHGTVPQLQGFVGNFLKVPGGREFLVQVPGVAQSGLTDDEIAAVLNWTLLEFSRNELPEDFRPYDGRDVAGYRAGRLIDVTPVRAQLLEEMRKRNITAY